MDYLEELKKLENKVKLKLNNHEREIFEKDLFDFKEALKEFSKLNLDNVKEQLTPFDICNCYSEGDNLIENTNWNMSNIFANRLKDGYFYLPINSKNDKEK